MAIKRNELMASLGKRDADRARETEAKIDSALGVSWETDAKHLMVPLAPIRLTDGTKAYLVRAYKEAGWAVRFEEHDDQRDGFSCSVLVKPLEP